MPPVFGELVPWSSFGQDPCCCPAGCIESASDPTQPLVAKAQTSPDEVLAWVLNVTGTQSVQIGVGSNGLYLRLELVKGPNNSLTQTWTLTLPTKRYPKLSNTSDYDLCVKGYKLTRNCAYTVSRFGGSWGSASLSGTTLTNAWRWYFRRGHYFKPAQVGATDAWWLYSGQDGNFPFYGTLTTPEFYLMVEPATSESFTESDGGTPVTYAREGGFAWHVPTGAFTGLKWKVRVWWRVNFNTHYNITGTSPNNLVSSNMVMRNELFFNGNSSSADAVLNTDYEELPNGDSGSSFPPI